MTHYHTRYALKKNVNGGSQAINQDALLKGIGNEMPLNKSKGNMYPFITHTWNTVKGKCPHDCSYCYMKDFPQNDMRFDQKELRTKLSTGRFIFIGSSCDMWAEDVPEKWILKTLEYCRGYGNKYLFQSKNPIRMLKLRNYIPPNSILGTTIETNRWFEEMGNSPNPKDRMFAIHSLFCEGWQTMVTIEPVMDFDFDDLRNMIHLCKPEWVNIGADSKGHNLPEPNVDKIKELIRNLQGDGVEVKLKDNLKRLGV